MCTSRQWTRFSTPSAMRPMASSTCSGPAGDVFAVTVPPGEWDKSVLLGFEREMLGLYVSDHPLFGVEQVLVGVADMSIATLHADGAADGQTVAVAGILSGVNRRVTKA